MKKAALLNSQKEIEGVCLKKCHALEELEELSQKLLLVRNVTPGALHRGTRLLLNISLALDQDRKATCPILSP